jgi:hypothetical protein
MMVFFSVIVKKAWLLQHLGDFVCRGIRPRVEEHRSGR